MDRADTWRVIAGSVTVGLLLTVLLSTPSMIVARSVQVIDTELRDSAASPQRVVTKVDVAKPEDLTRIPKTLGAWNMSRVNEWDRVAEFLNTNVLLSREYTRPDLVQPVNLLVIQSGNLSSFHPAPVCYRVQGWFPDDDVLVAVPVANGSWAQGPWLSSSEGTAFHGTVQAKLLPVEKRDANGNVTERREALYVYMKQQRLRVTNEVVWIRVEMPLAADSDGSDEAPILASLLGEVIPSLFDFAPNTEVTLAESVVHQFGIAGGVGLAGLVAIPALVAVWPFLPRVASRPPRP